MQKITLKRKRHKKYIIQNNNKTFCFKDYLKKFEEKTKEHVGISSLLLATVTTGQLTQVLKNDDHNNLDDRFKI